MHNALIDPELQFVIERWPDLPATLKAGILAMVESCTGQRRRRMGGPFVDLSDKMRRG